VLSVLIVFFSGDTEEDMRWKAEQRELDALLRGGFPVWGIFEVMGRNLFSWIRRANGLELCTYCFNADYVQAGAVGRDMRAVQAQY
jgi:hypothetical protein